MFLQTERVTKKDQSKIDSEQVCAVKCKSFVYGMFVL